VEDLVLGEHRAGQRADVPGAIAQPAAHPPIREHVIAAGEQLLVGGQALIGLDADEQRAAANGGEQSLRFGELCGGLGGKCGLR